MAGWISVLLFLVTANCTLLQGHTLQQPNEKQNKTFFFILQYDFVFIMTICTFIN